MIKFPANARYTDIIGSKIIEKNQVKLEETLRKLGNFDSKQPIKIFNHHKITTQNITLYEVMDLDNTIFTFTNFTTNNFNDKYKLTMKRKNSRFTYKYSFRETPGTKYQENQEAENYIEKLRIIEISCDLTKDRKIRFERECMKQIRMIIEVGSKQYVLESPMYHEDELLGELESIVEKLLKTETMNLENILLSINNKKLINAAYVINNGKILAQLAFSLGKLCSYEFEQPLVKVNAIISSQIYRSTQRIINNQIEINNETFEKDSENTKIQADYIKLFKKL